MLCCICNDEIGVEANGWTEGHNASPVVPQGRCCKKCNHTHVIPARLSPEYMRNEDSIAHDYLDGKLELDKEKIDAVKSARKDDEERKQAARDGMSTSVAGMGFHTGGPEYISDVLRNMIREAKDKETIEKASKPVKPAKSKNKHKAKWQARKPKRKSFNRKWRDKNR